MTQTLFAFEPLSLTDRIAAVFEGRPGEWIDAHDLLKVGGFAGWRTRISELRTQRGLTIQNRVRYVKTSSGWIKVSEYRWVR